MDMIIESYSPSKAKKAVIANCVPKLVAMAMSLSPSAPLDSHLTHDSLGPSEPTTQTASRSVQPFLHGWPQHVRILYNGTFLSPSNCPFPWGGIWTSIWHLYRCSRFLQGSLVWQTDRLTDGPHYSVGNNRLHYTNDARLQVEHSNMLSLGWHVITRAQPEWWHFNRGTTYLNVPRASVLHLSCRMTNYEQVQRPDE